MNSSNKKEGVLKTLKLLLDEIKTNDKFIFFSFALMNNLISKEESYNAYDFMYKNRPNIDRTIMWWDAEDFKTREEYINAKIKWLEDLISKLEIEIGQSKQSISVQKSL